MIRLRLKVANGELKDQIFEVKEGGLRLGRSSSNDIHVPDEELSRNHCLFEPLGDFGVRLTDLASANGTYLNGKMLGSDPVDLKEGDLIGVGSVTIRVIGEDKPQEVDLGLGTTKNPVSSGKRRSPIANVLWLVAIAVSAAAIYLVLNPPKIEEAEPEPVKNVEPVLTEAVYERVSGSKDGIFRYEMKFSEDGVLTVRIDDVPAQNRHHQKSKPLSDSARQELAQILSYKVLKDIDREYVGIEPDPPALESWTLKTVYDSHARSIRIVNTQEPEVFRQVREKLEAFSKSELGIWAIQYPKEKLLQLAQDSIDLGSSKWEDRDVNYGNLAASIAAYREAMFYLETVEPKPAIFDTAREGFKRSTEELDRRYADQRFLADRALNLGQFDTAKRELSILLEMVPDRNDDRYRDANDKLMSAEKQLQQKGGKK